MTDEEQIEQNQVKFIAAVNAGDVDAMMALSTEDTLVMPPNAPALVGAAAVRPWAEGFFGQFTADLTTVTDDLAVSGDMGFARRSFAWTLRPKAGGEPIRDNGKTVLIYRKEADGSWKLALDIWNSDVPLT